MMNNYLRVKLLSLFTVCFVGLLSAQENQKNQDEFRLQFVIGAGFGFNKVDLFEIKDEDGETASIRGGGGFNVGVGTRYIFKQKLEIGANFIFHVSSLTPELSNASATFKRFSLEPNVKYHFDLNSKENRSTLNIGAGYGFYNSPKMKIEADDLGFSGTIKYDNASGPFFLTEYEFHGVKKSSLMLGLKFYSVTYDSKIPVENENELSRFKGSGIDFYLGYAYRL